MRRCARWCGRSRIIWQRWHRLLRLHCRLFSDCARPVQAGQEHLSECVARPARPSHRRRADHGDPDLPALGFRLLDRGRLQRRPDAGAAAECPAGSDRGRIVPAGDRRGEPEKPRAGGAGRGASSVADPGARDRADRHPGHQLGLAPQHRCGARSAAAVRRRVLRALGRSAGDGGGTGLSRDRPVARRASVLYSQQDRLSGRERPTHCGRFSAAQPARACLGRGG